MQRFSYRERDYAFGQAMLSLRTSIGLTQAGLADLLGVSRRAVGEWRGIQWTLVLLPASQIRLALLRWEEGLRSLELPSERNNYDYNC